MAKAYKPRGTILGYDGENGKRPIFAYVPDGPKKGIPCCGAKSSKPCGFCCSIARFDNGRCKHHGGMAVSGVDHCRFRGGEYAKAFKDKSTVKMMMDALDDPLYTELRDEIALNTIEIQKLTQQLNGGLSPEQMTRLMFVMEEIERTFFSKQVMAFVDAMKSEGIPLQNISYRVEEAVKILRQGVDEEKLLKRIGETSERRRKLVETETKRLQIERNNMPADQVVRLFKEFVGVVTEVFKHDTVGLRAFAYKVDELSGLMNGGQQAFAGRSGVIGIVEPQSALTERVKQQVQREEAFEVDFTDLSEKPTTTRKLRF